MSQNPTSSREPRYPARLEITLTSGARSQTVFTNNVSFRGLFACTDAPPEIRQLITVSASLPPSGAQFSSHAMCVHIRGPHQVPGLPPGVGIQFFAQSADAKERWNEFIRHVRSGTQTRPEPVAKPPPPPRPPPPPPLRRHHTRYRAVLAVRPRSVAELEMLYTRDVSKGGMFLSTSKEITIGSEIRLDVHHPTKSSVFRLQSVVRHFNATPPRGIGVEFVAMTEARRSEFLEFVREGFTSAEPEVEFIAESDPRLA